MSTMATHVQITPPTVAAAASATTALTEDMSSETATMLQTPAAPEAVGTTDLDPMDGVDSQVAQHVRTWLDDFSSMRDPSTMAHSCMHDRSAMGQMLQTDNAFTRRSILDIYKDIATTSPEFAAIYELLMQNVAPTMPELQTMSLNDFATQYLTSAGDGGASTLQQDTAPPAEVLQTVFDIIAPDIQSSGAPDAVMFSSTAGQSTAALDACL